MPPITPQRHDAFIHVEASTALDLLHLLVLADPDLPETYPSAM